jgi:gluconate 5-dehydrogenase
MQSLMLEINQKDVELTLKNCLESVILTTDIVARHMIASKSKGSIVNIASMYGIVSPYPQVYTNHPTFHNPPAYGAAKAGIIQFSRYSACHLAPYGIRVNTISPGAFPNSKVQKDTDFIEELEKRIPLGRIGLSHEIADPVIFLLSDKSSYITGHNLVVDGGWTAW